MGQINSVKVLSSKTYIKQTKIERTIYHKDEISKQKEKKLKLYLPFCKPTKVLTKNMNQHCPIGVKSVVKQSILSYQKVFISYFSKIPKKRFVITVVYVSFCQIYDIVHKGIKVYTR